jgi:hypothetical protein
MKTAMQELLGLIEQMFNNAKTIEVESAINDVINIITQQGLEKEEEQIRKAYLLGHYDSSLDIYNPSECYNEIQKQNKS